MKRVSRLFAVLAFFGLAGCGTLSVESFLNQELSGGDSFLECLAREYQDRATSEAYVDCNWLDTVVFVERGREAAAGNMVMPLDPANHAVDGELSALQDARSRLLAALDDGGRDDADRACACAKAQRHYDGWVEQASDNGIGVGGSFFGGPGGAVQPDRVASERAAFEEAIVDCEKKMDIPDFTIYFGFDRFDLTAEASAVIGEIASLLSGQSGYSVSVIGHTDTVGSKAYNQALGQRRADSVKTGLMDAGVSNVSSVSMGQTALAVETGDGVREPLNRRAEIQINQ